MCKTYGKEPDDPWFEEIPPVKWLWMYQSWLQDLEDKHKFAKDYTILSGSFVNYEMAQKMLDPQNRHESTSTDLDRSMEMVREAPEKPLHRRRRGVVDVNA